MASEVDSHVGKVIGEKYRIERKLGEGGMGQVYLARQIFLNKPVALKVLRKSLLTDERTVARFQREAKAASRLNHPNSIGLLDFGSSADGALFIAMEYVAGKDLHQILSTEWPLEETRIIRIVSQVLSALADAHAAGVIHRDLKPENIMVEQRHGEPDSVKVLDFGIAKIIDPDGPEGPALTRTGFVCGTPEYMSPEQARGGAIDQRSDLYAVGVVLYQLATRFLPFEPDVPGGISNKLLTSMPPLPSRRNPEARISSAMERLIMRALSKEPDDRPQSAQRFRSELIKVGRRERRRRFSGWWQKNQWFKVAVAASVMAVVCVVGLLAFHRRPKLQNAPQDSVQVLEQRRNPTEARQLVQEGDDAHRDGQNDVAIVKYEEAFAKNPTPEVALKLGELYFQRNDTENARVWWLRHLRERPDSNARRYIREAIPDL